MSRNAIRAGKKLCAECGENEKKSKIRTETLVNDYLKENVGIPSVSSTMPGIRKASGTCNGDRRRHGDCIYVLTDRIIQIETDEDSHSEREVVCELGKLDGSKGGLAPDLFKLPLLIIRFNPDAYDGALVGFQAKLRRLANEVKKWMHAKDLSSLCTKRVNVIYMFYHSKSKKHIDAALEKKASINVVGVI